jgi:hypothetical protein
VRIRWYDVTRAKRNDVANDYFFNWDDDFGAIADDVD